MKRTLKAIFTLLLPACMLVICASTPVKAQIDSAAIKRQISTCADSLVRSYYEKDWKTFIALTHPGIARLYGGMSNYASIIQRNRQRYEDSVEEKPEQVNIKQFVFNGSNWQCVIERIHDTHLSGKSARITSYMIGQSKDGLGDDWKFFDVGDNLMVNISAIMPDFSDELIVPEKKIVYEGDEAKSSTATTASPAPKAKKKAPGKK
jgi:hypothetical protein